MRQAVTNAVHIQNAIAFNDLLDFSKTQTDLIALLARAALPASDGGLGFDVLLTAINSDHHDDSCLGIHTHHSGYAVDIGTVNGVDIGDNPQTLLFCQAMAGNNKWVVKVGLGGPASAFMQQLSISFPQTIVFVDNQQPHVHLQTI